MDLLDGIKGRRSINFFEPGREVPDEKLTELMDLANTSPSSMNLQPWHVVVVRTPERKKALRKAAFDQPKVEEASVVLIMVADPECVEKNMGRLLDSWIDLGYMGPEKREMYEGMIKGLHETPESRKRAFTAVKNTALYAMTLMIAARGLGLETHPMDGFDEAAVKKEFGIPEEMLVPMLVCVGYLKEGVALLPRAFRRELGEFVSYERYSE